MLFWALLCAVPAYGADNAAAVLEAVRTKALQPPPAEVMAAYAARPDRQTREAIREFLAQFDPWASWLEAGETAEDQKLRKGLGSGVGLDIVRNRAGELVCLPYPDSPAEKGGLQEGDILLAVDGYSVVDADLADVPVLVMGKVGTTVEFTVFRPFPEKVVPAGEEPPSQRITVVRGAAKAPTVRLFREDGFMRLRIYKFNENTRDAFDNALAEAASSPLVIDLRGNSGGLMQTALVCATRLLPADVPVLTVRSREGEKTRRTAKTGAFAHRPPVVIWQDNLTASAAEVFVGALGANRRATVVGAASYGKAQAQDVIDINGNQLFLTTESLTLPEGQSWQEVGLAPHVWCKPLNRDELLTATRRAFGSASR